MQTTQTKVEYSGITATTTINNNIGIGMSNNEDSGNLRHPTSLAINSNYRLHQRDRVNRFTTNNTATPTNSSDSCTSPVDFESITASSSSSSITPPKAPLTSSSTKSASYQTSSISSFLSGIRQRQKQHLQQQQQPKQSSDTKRTDEEEEALLQWKDMPKYLQFNPYVLRGYRPLSTFKGCCFSLFYWHNETVNILTHGEFCYFTQSYF